MIGRGNTIKNKYHRNTIPFDCFRGPGPEIAREPARCLEAVLNSSTGTSMNLETEREGEERNDYVLS